ncbi:hypothetical protein FC98_GL000015 [Lentilactobacillus kisonensis DSM 19906 = JCM 15041]|uniref:Uncharacterized protein n=1 Tax=Lentilactobacillus kisonensis DSM 19906 = JCM 15041 TaxID=1423766 RepID=A0A0R1NSJ5_9LACO|nr:hypothetical protein FC98_GL000015 [Lentilactobacillus kisonensis DSM 19906 = JCM 15041]
MNGNLGNQEVVLSDNTTGTFTGVRVFGSPLSGNQVVQWTFISTGHTHEGFVYAGDLHEGLEIKSMNGHDTYKIHFMSK